MNGLPVVVDDRTPFRKRKWNDDKEKEERRHEDGASTMTTIDDNAHRGLNDGINDNAHRRANDKIVDCLFSSSIETVDRSPLSSNAENALKFLTYLDNKNIDRLRYYLYDRLKKRYHLPSWFVFERHVNANSLLSHVDLWYDYAPARDCYLDRLDIADEKFASIILEPIKLISLDDTAIKLCYSCVSRVIDRFRASTTTTVTDDGGDRVTVVTENITTDLSKSRQQRSKTIRLPSMPSITTLMMEQSSIETIATKQQQQRGSGNGSTTKRRTPASDRSGVYRRTSKASIPKTHQPSSPPPSSLYQFPESSTTKRNVTVSTNEPTTTSSSSFLEEKFVDQILGELQRNYNDDNGVATKLEDLLSN
ncbi:uncharacterized protein [Linepithema humile]|uniref:uncharacterized protein n=1 Tax=Linepithema humile TaxID=83485 RepID=UPI00351EC446